MTETVRRPLADIAFKRKGRQATCSRVPLERLPPSPRRMRFPGQRSLGAREAIGLTLMAAWMALATFASSRQ